MLAQDMALAPSFRVGAVIGTSFKIWARNIAFFGIVSLAAHLPGFFLKSIQSQPTGSGLSSLASTSPSALCNLVFIQLLTAIICYGVLQQLRGRSIDYGACLLIGFGRFFPALFTAILAALATGIGFVLLIVPGIIWGLAFWVALPVCVVENLGPVESLKRSYSLTKDYRWSIFGIALLVLLIAVVGGLLIGGAVGFFIGASHIPLHPALDILGLVVESLVGSLSAVVATTAYYYLRAVKEGADIDQIVAVFE